MIGGFRYTENTNYRNGINNMPALKSDITLIVRVRGKGFAVHGVLLPGKQFMVKLGRSRSKKIPYATLTEIYTASRKWAAQELRGSRYA